MRSCANMVVNPWHQCREINSFRMTIPVSADGCDGTFLRLLFRRVGNDDISLLDFFLFERMNQHAIAERFHIDCHMFCILLDQDPNAVSDSALECFGRGNNLLWPTGAPSLIIPPPRWVTPGLCPRC